VDPAGRCEIARKGNRWQVKLTLRDWQEIAVVE
jgi:hypothetical protein